MERTTQYPAHLAKLVANRLRSQHGNSPAEAVLTRLLETLYFASLKTDEGRPILCTVNYVDPQDRPSPRGRPPADCWSHVPFERPLPFDVRTLAKLARAADPAVSSLAVYRDKRNKLFIWGMVDQEPRHSEFITLGASPTPERPGLFQATITGVGNISVYQNDALIGSLEQNTLVEEYHDVLWAGPVHDLLVGYLHSYLVDTAAKRPEHIGPETLEAELLMRWINAICRILINIQRYRHGGGLLITTQTTLDLLNVKYKIRYDRLLKSLRRMVESQLLTSSAVEPPPPADQSPEDVVPYAPEGGENVFDRQRMEHTKEVLGAVRFIASLSCVDGFVLLDRRMVVHGFGVEVRTDNLLSDIFVARDSHANPNLLRQGELTQYGTRHRAMMRYCYDKPGALGFVVSQDGDIRAMTRIADMLVLWENIDVQLAYRPMGGYLPGQRLGPVLRRVNARVA
ncbi:MAG: putative sensor domain DACNV-containing protein [Pirellulales bacterium]